jgi:phosphate transport system protein
MPRETFQRHLQGLIDDVLVLGSMVENALIDSVESLRTRNMEGARSLVAVDRFINEKRFAIEGDAITLMATQQPMAGDLRTIAAVLEIATELERIGDYAKGIAKINLTMDQQALVKPLVYIPLMADKTQQMLRQALDAFARRDVELAQAVPASDDQIDALYNQIYRELLNLIMANPRALDGATYLLWAAHNLERSADRVVNICERVIFTVTGELVELGGDEDMDVEGSG